MSLDLQDTLRHHVLQAPQWTVDELARAASCTVAQLMEGLARLHEESMVSDPAVEPIRVTNLHEAWAPWVRAQEAEAARRSADASRLRDSLTTGIALERAQLNRSSFVVHERLETARDRLEELSASARFECLSLNPGPGLPPDAMDAAKPLDQEAMERGVQIRSIYQESFILDPGTMAFADWFQGLGGQIRTQPTVERQIIIIDREIAFVVPTMEHLDDGLALEIANPTLVEVFTNMFESMWVAARPYTTRLQRNWKDLSDPQARTLLVLLATGATDEQAARKLGVSERTARRLMANLMQAMGAVSRFQAGVEAVRQGLL